MCKPFLKKSTVFPQIVKKTGHLSLSDSVEKTCVQHRTGGDAGEMVKERFFATISIFGMGEIFVITHIVLSYSPGWVCPLFPPKPIFRRGLTGGVISSRMASKTILNC